MVRSCPLAELLSALTQSGCSKSAQPRATKLGVGLGGKRRCECVKQPNDPFVLRSQPCRRATLLTFSDSSSNSTAAIPIVCALKLSRALAVLLTPAVACKNLFRLYGTHFDRYIMTGDSKATICRDHHVVTRKG